MSIDIMIQDDQDQSIVGKYECFFCLDEDGNSMPSCVQCGGTGEITYKRSKWRMNLNNFNFAEFWRRMGLDSASNGSGKIVNFWIQTGMESGEESGIIDVDHLIQVLSDDDQVKKAGEYARYIPRLKEIALEARRQRKVIVWG